MNICWNLRFWFARWENSSRRLPRMQRKETTTKSTIFMQEHNGKLRIYTLTTPRYCRSYNSLVCPAEMIYINYPGICEPFTASIQTNIVATRLGGKPENLHKSNAGAILGSTLMALRTSLMNKDEDLPPLGTNFPVRGYYLAGSQTYCLWSILCRSSSKLRRLDF